MLRVKKVEFLFPLLAKGSAPVRAVVRITTIPSQLLINVTPNGTA